MNSGLAFAPDNSFSRGTQAGQGPADAPRIPVKAQGTGQQSLTRCPGDRRDDGTANTMTQSASIARPMNSNTNASTAIPPINR